MTRCAAVFLVSLAAQAADNSLLRGGYHFVQLRIAGAGAEAVNAGGTLTFDGAGRYQIRARAGKGKNPAAELARAGTYDAAGEPGAILIDNPVEPGPRLRLRYTAGAAVLAGSAGVGGAHEVLVAVRAPAAPVTAALLNGIYAGGFMALHGAAPEGLATAFVELHANGAGGFGKSLAIAHAASIDDVNREETRSGSTYRLEPNGWGSAKFEGPSDALHGDREILVSGDGEMLLGYGVSSHTRDILVAVRKPAEAASFQFQGPFWMFELFAENEFAFRPKTARFGSAEGIIVGRGEGTALLSQHVRTDGRGVHLTTSNRYQLSATGSLDPAGKAGVNNFALNVAAGVFAGAHAGAKGELSLGHGVFLGLRIPPVESASGVMLSPHGVAHRAAPELPVTAIAPGVALSLHGHGFAAPDPKSIVVTINGAPVEAAPVSPGRIDVKAPESLEPGVAAFQVTVSGRASNVVTVAVVPASPMVLTASPSGTGVVAAAHPDGSPVSLEKPAVAGQPVSIRVSGLGPKAGEVGILFDGRPEKVTAAAPAPDAPGVHLITVRAPASAGGAPAKIAIVAPDSVSDLADLPVTGSKGAQ